MTGWKQRGFLLVEVLVACVIITVALLAVASLYMQSLRASRQAEEYTVAATLAQDRLEKLKAGQILTNPHIVLKNGIAYNVISDSTPAAQANLKLQTVTVSWVIREQSRTFTLTTYMAENI